MSGGGPSGKPPRHFVIGRRVSVRKGKWRVIQNKPRKEAGRLGNDLESDEDEDFQGRG
jgi:hypothetical protein